MSTYNSNPPDLVTQAVNGEKVMKYKASMGFDVANGRANTAPAL